MVAPKSRVLLGKGEIQYTTFDRPQQKLELVTDVAIGKCISIMVKQKYWHKKIMISLFVKHIGVPIVIKYYLRKKTLRTKLNRDSQGTRVQDL